MTIATTLSRYLDNQGIDYDLVDHNPTMTSLQTAESAHIPGDQLAKSVILEDESGYVMAVLPSTYRVKVGKLNKLLHRKLGLATEPELEELFEDCAVGAIPPLGQAYQIETVWDDSLTQTSEVYFEAGMVWHGEVCWFGT